MGNDPPKKRDPIADKRKFEIACLKTKAYLEVYRDKRQNSASSKEKHLLQCLSLPTRSKQDEVQKAMTIIGDLNYVKACNIVIRNCEILRDNSMHIIDSRGRPDRIPKLLPCVDTVCWAAKPLNLLCIGELTALIDDFFGKGYLEAYQKGERVDQELKDCFKDVIPTPIAINDYFVNLSDKNGFPLESINRAGHEFARTQTLPSQNNYYPYQPPESYPPPSNYSFGAAPPSFEGAPFGQGFPPPHAGFPGGFPGGGMGGYPPPQNFQAGGYPPYGDGGYNNDGYPQNFVPNVPPPLPTLPSGPPSIPAGNKTNNPGYPQFEGKKENDIPNLDDFEERIRKLRENI
jgi:hypothetical protein